MTDAKEIITFTIDVFPKIIKVLGLKNLKCHYCNTGITKNNVSALLTPKIVICKSNLCIVEAFEDGKLK